MLQSFTKSPPLIVRNVVEAFLHAWMDFEVELFISVNRRAVGPFELVFHVPDSGRERRHGFVQRVGVSGVVHGVAFLFKVNVSNREAGSQ